MIRKPSRIVSLGVAFVVVVAAAALLDYVSRGHGLYRTVATNLLVPKASSGVRVVSLTAVSPAAGRVYDVTIQISPEPGAGIWRVPRGAEMRLQLASGWQTRLLVIRPPLRSHDASRWEVLKEVLRGESRLLVVPHRGWIRLGQMPEGLAPFEVQIYGLLPGNYGFVCLAEEKAPDFRRFDIVCADQPDVGRVPGTIRYQLAVPEPVGYGEALARLVFFVGHSRALLVAALTSLALLAAGVGLLAAGRASWGVAALAVSGALLFATCLPPLHGADETTHAAGIEKIVFTGQRTKDLDPYPRSIALVAEALDQDSVQFNPEATLPLAGAERRSAIAGVLGRSLAREAIEASGPAPAGSIQDSTNRAAAFFNAFGFVSGALKDANVLERLSIYRLGGVLQGILFALAGVAVLVSARVSQTVFLCYGITALLPFPLSVIGTVSNYSPATGLGLFVAAAAVAAALAPTPLRRSLATAALLLAAAYGILLWKDFLFLLALSVPVAATVALTSVLQRFARIGRRPALARALAAGIVFVLALPAIPRVLRVDPSKIDARFSSYSSLKLNDPEITPFVQAAAVPLLLGLLVAAGLVAASTAPEERRRRILVAASVFLGAVLLVGFLATPFQTVRFEDVGMPFPAFLEPYARTILSNGFTWDQDRATWKFTVGTFGWLDTYYPDWFYALTRWAFGALFVVAPVLVSESVKRRRDSSVRLVLVASAAASLMMAATLVRATHPAFYPQLRFAIPFFPGLVFPLLVLLESEGRERVFRGALLALVAIDVWTAISIVGARYYLGSPYPI